MKIDWSKSRFADEKAAEKDRARRFLAETDWMVTRSIETGKPIPDDIKAAREEARRTASK